MKELRSWLPQTDKELNTFWRFVDTHILPRNASWHNAALLAVYDSALLGSVMLGAVSIMTADPFYGVASLGGIYGSSYGRKIVRQDIINHS